MAFTSKLVRRNLSYKLFAANKDLYRFLKSNYLILAFVQWFYGDSVIRFYHLLGQTSFWVNEHKEWDRSDKSAIAQRNNYNKRLITV